MRQKINAIILRNENEEDHLLWIKACNNFKAEIDFRIVNLTGSSWFEEIHKKSFDILLAKPGGFTAPLKQLYDERIYILGKTLNYKIYPTVDEILIYENKRLLSFWLKATEIQHPNTYVFYDKIEAINFINNYILPIVAKTNIGASGSGIKVLYNKEDTINYIYGAFSGKGAVKRTGPDFQKGGILKRGFHYVLHPDHISKKLKVYAQAKSDPQIGFVIFQEYVKHQFEWRVVRIGDSYFAHKKLVNKGKASGSLLKGYENPPFKLLEFVKQITDRFDFKSQAVDIFETENGEYSVNEMQCIFGQSDLYQMQVDGEPGRYRYLNNKWVFEKGNFAENACYNLRIEYVLSLF